jgi:hypothetical protein
MHTPINDTTSAVRDTLAERGVHDLWTERFHNREVESFYEIQFDEIANVLRAAP